MFNITLNGVCYVILSFREVIITFLKVYSLELGDPGLLPSLTLQPLYNLGKSLFFSLNFLILKMEILISSMIVRNK